MVGLEELVLACCRLCRKIMRDKNFEVIDYDFARSVQEGLLLRLNSSDEGKKQVMCSACRVELKKALEFKSVCLDTESTIFRYVDGEKALALDLTEIYSKENDSKPFMGLSNDQRICRLCLQPAGNVRSIHEAEADAIQSFVPEMNVCVVKDAVMCKPCFESLCTHNRFLKGRLDVEEKIDNVIEDNRASRSECDTPLLDVPAKVEVFEQEFEGNEFENVYIKSEGMDIKLEEDEQGSRVGLCDEVGEASDGNSQDAVEAGHISWVESETDPLQTQMYTCDECLYQSKDKYNLQSHQLKHKDPSEVKMYDCDKCLYRSKYKCSLRKHQIHHKDPSEVRMYKCNECPYQSKYKSGLREHQLRHKDPSEAVMYKCDICSYQTKDKRCLRMHHIKHKDPAQARMYNCDTCSYRSVYGSALRRHQIKHEVSSRVKMYKCDQCEHETKYRDSFMKHQKRHMDLSEGPTYKCD